MMFAFRNVDAWRITALLLLVPACVHGESPSVRLEYRFASYVANPFFDDREIEGSPRDCTEGMGAKSEEYRLPGGRLVSAKVVAEGGLLLILDRAEVLLHALVSPNPSDKDRVYADVVLKKTDKNQALAFRREHLECQLAVFVDGTLVALEPWFTLWAKSVPGGIYASSDAAMKFLERPGIVVTEVPLDPHDTARADSYWNWKREHDLWRVKCDEQFRTSMREQAPELFSELSSRTDFFAGIDCNHEPIPPGGQE